MWHDMSLLATVFLNCSMILFYPFDGSTFR
jgi:hypothetical protein